jgi:hypothetical protein
VPLQQPDPFVVDVRAAVAGSVMHLSDLLFEVIRPLAGALHELAVEPFQTFKSCFSFGGSELDRPLRFEARSLKQALPLFANVLPPPLPAVSAREVELGSHRCHRHPHPQEKWRRRRPQPKLREKYSSSGE